MQNNRIRSERSIVRKPLGGCEGAVITMNTLLFGRMKRLFTLLGLVFILFTIGCGNKNNNLKKCTVTGKGHNFRLCPEESDPADVPISTFKRYRFHDTIELNKYQIENYGHIYDVVNAVCIDCKQTYRFVLYEYIERLGMKEKEIDKPMVFERMFADAIWDIFGIMAQVEDLADSMNGMDSDLIAEFEAASTTEEITEVLFEKTSEIREMLSESDVMRSSYEDGEKLRNLLNGMCNEPEKYKDEFRKELDGKLELVYFDWADKHYNEADCYTDLDTTIFFEFKYKFDDFVEEYL